MRSIGKCLGGFIAIKKDPSVFLEGYDFYFYFQGLIFVNI